MGGYVSHRNRTSLGERMVRGADEDELLGVERAQLQVRMVDRSAQSDLHLIVKHQVGDVL